MSKNMRQKISHAIQSAFRSSPKSKIISCCSVKKPDDYEYVLYQPKQTSTNNNDYIDLSECHSWSLSYSKDSGVSFDSNEKYDQLQSTKINSDDSSSLSTLSNLSYIPHDPVNISYSDVSTQQPTYECCRCQCHQYINNNNLLRGEANRNLYVPEKYENRQIKTKIYPFIF